MVLTYGASGIGKMALKDFEQKLNDLEVKNPPPHVALVSSERLELQMSIMDPKAWRSIGQIVMSIEGAMKMALELKRVAAPQPASLHRYQNTLSLKDLKPAPISWNCSLQESLPGSA